MNLVKSPLRYPGGKSRAVEFLHSHLPRDFGKKFEIFIEPFFGGGSFGLFIAQRFPHLKIYANDLNYDLFCFWECLKNESEGLIDGVVKLKNAYKNGRDLYEFLRQKRGDFSADSKLERAIDFFVLNRCTFSGLIDCGGFSQKAFESRFTHSSIERLRSVAKIIQNIEFSSESFENFLAPFSENEKCFMFLDPPYFKATKSKLYGKKGDLHEGFAHETLQKLLTHTRAEFLMTYDDSSYIKNLYKNFEILKWSLQYGMNNFKQKVAPAGQELLISKSRFKAATNNEGLLF